MDKKKESCFNYIFTNLDFDMDGKISSRDMNVFSNTQIFPSEMKAIFQELIDYIIRTDALMNKEEFMQQANKIFKTLTIPQRTFILKFLKSIKSTSSNEEFLFHIVK